MKSKQLSGKYVALLRGINVGGHHKVPMAGLRKEMENLGFTNIITLLNSGNVIFEASATGIDELERTITEDLEKHFGFSIPVLLRTAEGILHIRDCDPFKNIEVAKDTRLYVSFLKYEPRANFQLPWTTKDNAYQILDVKDKAVFSVLDLSVSQTTKGMDALEQLFGKEITTRNWNTIVKIAEEL